MAKWGEINCPRCEMLEEHLCLTEEKLAKAVEAMQFWSEAVEPDVDKAITLMASTLAELKKDRAMSKPIGTDERLDRIAALEAKLAQQDAMVQAAVAAALKEAAQAIQGDEMLSPVGAHRVSARILTFITPDAQAALERVVAAERERIISVYRKLATGSTVGAGDGETFVVQYVDPEQFAAAIREGGE